MDFRAPAKHSLLAVMVAVTVALTVVGMSKVRLTCLMSGHDREMTTSEMRHAQWVDMTVRQPRG